jgi:hypothetical protein
MTTETSTQPIPPTREGCLEEIRCLNLESAKLKIDLSHNLPVNIAAPKRHRRAEIQDRIAALSAATKRMKGEHHADLMEAFYHAAHQVLDEALIADIWDCLYELHPELEKK